jgi:hypothetical protein
MANLLTGPSDAGHCTLLSASLYSATVACLLRVNQREAL